MTCRIFLKNSCTQSFHSLEEQEYYEKGLDLYDAADEIKELNKRKIFDLQREIEDLENEIENAYDEAHHAMNHLRESKE